MFLVCIRDDVHMAGDCDRLITRLRGADVNRLSQRSSDSMACGARTESGHFHLPAGASAVVAVSLRSSLGIWALRGFDACRQLLGGHAIWASDARGAWAKDG